MRQTAIYPGLEGKSVFVTGGGSGIGAALTTAFIAQKARVAFVDIADGPSRILCEELAAEHGTAPLFLHCDIRDVPALEAAIARAGAENGDIAVLLNNAGNDERHAVEDVTVEYWDDRMAINQRPMFFAAQAVLPQMKRRGGGAIVNFGSIAWRLGQAVFPAYVTAKASVHGLTRGLARAFGPFNIRVNSLLPGWVMTERQLALWMTPEGDAERRAGQCLDLRIQPEDVAAMALFLASDAGRACTSQEFIVDAGWCN